MTTPLNPSTPHSDAVGATSTPFLRYLTVVSLTTVGALLSTWAYQFGQPDGPLFYWGIFPGLPFALLAAIGLFPRVPVRAILGGGIGGLASTALTYGLLYYSSTHYSGGGANIGLGLLLLASPVILPLGMVIGGFLGRVLGKRRS